MQRVLVLAALLAVPITGPAGASPSVLASANSRGVRVEQVEIKTSDQLTLTGSFYAPKRRAPAVLLVHDAGSDREQLDFIAQRLSRKGLGVLTVDLRGHGDSKTSKLDWEKMSEEARASLWQLAPRDIDAAAAWVLKQPNIHSTNLSLVGYRAGCALVARHAEQDENVICMALLSPKAKDFGFDVEGAIHNVNGLPTYVIDRRNDETERLVTEANALSTPYIELVTISPKAPTVLEDSKMPSKVAKWVVETAKPKKGRG
jgi:pimeloyl-ACP methyl ester carboxylesterase